MRTKNIVAVTPHLVSLGAISHLSRRLSGYRAAGFVPVQRLEKFVADLLAESAVSGVDPRAILARVQSTATTVSQDAAREHASTLAMDSRRKMRQAV